MIYTESDSSSSRIRGTGSRRLCRFQNAPSSLIKFLPSPPLGMPGGEGWRRIANREPPKGDCDLAQSAACMNGLEDELPLCRVGKGVLIASSGALSGALRGDGGDADGGEAAGASSEVLEDGTRRLPISPLILTESAADAT